MKEYLEIINSVIESGKLYPRPILNCDKCLEEVILCWGDLRNPYLRHLNKKKHDHKPCIESFEHKISKELLINHFTENLTKEYDNFFLHYCNNQKIFLPKECVEFKPEVKFENIIFDIGCFDSQKNLIFGIEIYKTHKSDNIDVRNKINWVEISSSNILKYFSGKTSYLKDLSVKECCKKYLTYDIEQIAVILNFLEYKKAKNIDCILNIDQFGYYQSYKIWKFIECEYDLNKAEIDILNAKNNVNNKKENDVNECLKKNINKNLLRELKYRNKCLKCKKKHNFNISTPYCKKCTEIIHKNPIEIIKNNVKDIKHEIKNKLFWIKNIPDSTICSTNNNKDYCFKCNKNHIMVSFKNYYNIYYKKICYDCLDKEIEKRGIYFDFYEIFDV